MYIFPGLVRHNYFLCRQEEKKTKRTAKTQLWQVPEYIVFNTLYFINTFFSDKIIIRLNTLSMMKIKLCFRGNIIIMYTYQLCLHIYCTYFPHDSFNKT